MIVRLAERPSDGALYRWSLVSATAAFWDAATHRQNVADMFNVTVNVVAIKDVDTEDAEAVLTGLSGTSTTLPGEGAPRTVLACPPIVQPPDVLGFNKWLRDTMSVSLKEKVHSQYPGLIHALNQPDWPLVGYYLSDAKTNIILGLTSGQWNALRTAALTTYHLPATLPS